MKNDLVERLKRRRHYFLNAIEGEYDANLLGEVADAIEALSTTPGREEIAEKVLKPMLKEWDIGGLSSRVTSAKGHGSLPADICEAELHWFGEKLIDAILSLLRKEGV